MSPKPYWTKEIVFQQFAKWEEEHGKLPTSTDWKSTTQEKSDEARPDHPTSRTVAKMFGTWRGAIEEYLRSRPKKRWKIWTPEEILESVTKWTEEKGHFPTYFELGRAQNGQIPSMTAIRNRYPGGYQQLMKDVGCEPLPMGVTYKSLAKFKPLPRRGRS